MKEFQEKNKYKRRRRSRLILLLLFVLALFIIRGTFQAFAKERSSRVEADRVIAEHQRLEKRYMLIQEQNESLKNNSGVEAEIRSKFDVVKPGEGVIVIVDKELPVIEEDKRGVIKKFWDSVTGVFKDESGSTTKKR